MDTLMQTVLTSAVLVGVLKVIEILIGRRVPRAADPPKRGDPVLGFDRLVNQLQEVEATLRAENAELYKQLGQLRAELAELQVLRIQNTNLRSEVEALRAEVTRLRAQVADLEGMAT